jgi:hypothetical protein
MENFYLGQKTVEPPKSLENVLETHIANVEKGVFDPKDFSTGF